MGALRKKHKQNYTTIDNELITDERLSFRARGVAIYLLSKPDDWMVNLNEIQSAGTEGRESIRAAIKELTTLGYAMRDKEQSEDGTICTVTHVADYPAYINIGTPETRFIGYGDDEGNRPTRNPSYGGSLDIVNTDLLNNTTCYTDGISQQEGKAQPPATQDTLFVVEEKPRPQQPKDHPAVQAYRTLHERWPQKAQMKMIVEADPPLDDWVRAMKEWVGRGYNPQNVKVPLEWAIHPGLMEIRQGGTAKSIPDPTGGARWEDFPTLPDYGNGE